MEGREVEERKWERIYIDRPSLGTEYSRDNDEDEVVRGLDTVSLVVRISGKPPRAVRPTVA